LPSLTQPGSEQLNLQLVGDRRTELVALLDEKLAGGGEILGADEVVELDAGHVAGGAAAKRTSVEVVRKDGQQLVEQRDGASGLAVVDLAAGPVEPGLADRGAQLLPRGRFVVGLIEQRQGGGELPVGDGLRYLGFEVAVQGRGPPTEDVGVVGEG